MITVDVKIKGPKGAGKSHLSRQITKTINQQLREVPGTKIQFRMVEQDTPVRSWLCKLGFHKQEIREPDHSPTHGIMVLNNLYLMYCPRCGRTVPFHFWIDRF